MEDERASGAERLVDLMDQFSEEISAMSDSEILDELRALGLDPGVDPERARRSLLDEVSKFRRSHERAARRREADIIRRFHELYYGGLPGEGPIFERTFYLGVPTFKLPLDLWMYQEIIFELRPDLIIEAGTYMGGSALYMAHVLDRTGKGEVVTIDIEERRPRPDHPRIRYVTGSSSDPALIESIMAGRPEEVRMVVLDSDHSKQHVLAEMRLLAPHVSVGSYLIVEDTNINGRPVLPSFGDGPAEAVEEFLASHSEFIVDRDREKFLLTFQPGGYLKRVR